MSRTASGRAAWDDLVDQAFALDKEHPFFSQTVEEPQKKKRNAGDSPGHEFHGNQWTNRGSVENGPPAGVLESMHQPDGGFTYSVVTKSSPKTGYALSLHKERERVLPKAADVTATDITRYARDNFDLLKESNNYLGGWNNPKDGKAYLDISTVVDSPDEAERLASEHGQLAYFDLKNGRSIETHHGSKRAARGGNGWSEGWYSDLRRPPRVDKVSLRKRTDTGGRSAGTQNLRRGNRPEDQVRSAGEWDESQHPRDEHGQFSSGGGTGGAVHEQQSSTSVGGVTVKGDASATKKLEDTFTNLPEGFRKDLPLNEVQAYMSPTVANDRISDYLEEHYGITQVQAVRALTDRPRGVIISTIDEKTFTKQIAHVLVNRSEDPEFKQLAGVHYDEHFQRIVNGLVKASEVADPLTYIGHVVEPAYHAIMKKWGWI